MMKRLHKVVLLGGLKSEFLRERLSHHLRELADVTDAGSLNSAHAVITSCSNEEELNELVLGPNGLLTGDRTGLIYVDVSWVGEALSLEIAKAANAAGALYLRAPVTHGPADFSLKTVSTAMVSGTQDAFEAARIILEGLAEKIVYLGEAEEARAMTAVLDVMTGVTLGMWAEALVFGEAAGLDWNDMLQVMETSAIASPLVKDHVGRVSQFDYESSLTCGMVGERLEAALARGKSSGVVLTLTGLAHQMFVGALGSGATVSGATAVIPWLEAAAGMQPAG
jgi:3-hydroxyisobutyrate dehydrogenase-like beta-hydroxyacid dehydrogenase